MYLLWSLLVSLALYILHSSPPGALLGQFQPASAAPEQWIVVPEALRS